MHQSKSKDDLDRTLMLARQLEIRCLALGLESSVRQGQAKIAKEHPTSYPDTALNQACEKRRLEALDLAPLSSERIKQDDAKFKRQLLEISRIVQSVKKSQVRPTSSAT